MTTLGFRLSRYRVNPAMLDDFPRYHPRAAARRRSGFTDISRYGLVFTYPTRNFATLGPFMVVTPLAVARVAGLGTGSRIRIRDRTISSLRIVRRVRRIVSEDSLRIGEP